MFILKARRILRIDNFIDTQSLNVFVLWISKFLFI